MADIHYNDQRYPITPNETLLDTLLRHGVEFPYSCKIGTCQSCLTKLVNGKIPSEAQKNLKSTLIAKNYFLACQCRPNSDISVKLPEQDDTTIASRIIGLSKLNHNVLQVKLAVDNPIDFKAGQYINLVAPGNIIRSYSIANVPKQHIELHIKLMTNGLMSRWLSQEAKLDSSVYIRGPMGSCFYDNPEKKSFPIFLAGTGTGLAPLIGIVRDGLTNNHNGEMILIHGGVSDVDLYFHETLMQLQKIYPRFHYLPCVLNGHSTIRKDSIDDVLIENIREIKDEIRLFVCGPAETTNKLKMKAFLAGVPSASIYSDSFIMAHQ